MSCTRYKLLAPLVTSGNPPSLGVHKGGSWTCSSNTQVVETTWSSRTQIQNALLSSFLPPIKLCFSAVVPSPLSTNSTRHRKRSATPHTHTPKRPLRHGPACTLLDCVHAQPPYHVGYAYDTFSNSSYLSALNDTLTITCCCH